VCPKIAIMRRTPLVLCGSVALLAVLIAAGCRRASEAAAPEGALPPFATELTIKDLMLNVIDTNADVVWLSVTTVASAEGLVETRPKTDEEWARVKGAAVTLAEAANLLMIPGRKVAPDDHKSEVPGIELEGHEIDALIAKDPQAFYKHARDLYAAAMIAARAADKKDADKVFEVGEAIEHACEGCHRAYWYPNEKIPELPVFPEQSSK
jgi:cytochrome c556